MRHLFVVFVLYTITVVIVIVVVNSFVIVAVYIVVVVVVVVNSRRQQPRRQQPRRRRLRRHRLYIISVVVVVVFISSLSSSSPLSSSSSSSPFSFESGPSRSTRHITTWCVHEPRSRVLVLASLAFCLARCWYSTACFVCGIAWRCALVIAQPSCGLAALSPRHVYMGIQVGWQLAL